VIEAKKKKRFGSIYKYIHRFALKVDLMNAYDSVKWNFVLAVLKTVGVLKVMVRWIEDCITTLRFSIGIDGYLARIAFSLGIEVLGKVTLCCLICLF